MKVSNENNVVEDLKSEVCALIDQHRAEIIDLGEKVWAHPKSGFNEYETAHRMAGLFNRMGLPCQAGLALTGVRTELRGSQPGPTMALLGEMDGTLLLLKLPPFQIGNPADEFLVHHQDRYPY